MENSNLEEEECIEIINNEVCYFNKNNYASNQILKNPLFLKWWNEEKRKKGEKGFLKQCEQCNIFFYLTRSNYDFKCKNNHYLNPICNYCACIFHGGSYCCAKRSLISVFRLYLLNGCYSCNTNQSDGLLECIKAAPFIFNLVFVGSFYYGLFFHIRIIVKEQKYSCYEQKTTPLSKAAVNNGYIYLIIFFQGYKHQKYIYSILSLFSQPKTR